MNDTNEILLSSEFSEIDLDRIFQKKKKIQSINQHANFYYVSSTLVAMFIFELTAQLYRHSFSTNEQTSSRIEAIIPHCSSKRRENIASRIFLLISTSKNRQTIVFFFRLRHQIVPLNGIIRNILSCIWIESRSIIFLIITILKYKFPW